MEILVVTLAYMAAGHMTEVLARLQVLASTLQNAPGLVSVRIYSGRERHPSYLILTTWEDEGSWQSAQGSFNPRNLLQSAASGLLASPPDQWQMHYLWGYSRPIAAPTIAIAQFLSVSPYEAEQSQRIWLAGLYNQEIKLALSFAFLARGYREDASPSRKRSAQFMLPQGEERSNTSNPVFLNVLSWASETECRAFYASPAYREIDTFLRSVGTTLLLLLEPL